MTFPRSLHAQAAVNETRDPHQTQYDDFAKLYTQWTGGAQYGSPLVDHLPKVSGIPSPKDVLGYYIGAPAKLTYYADILKYYRALAKAAPDRVKVEHIGTSDEGRELVVIWVSSPENIRNLQRNRDNLAKLADPRGRSDAEIRQLIATTKPNYHFMGGLHSGETGPSEMLMELAYRLVTETSPLVSQIRNNVIVSITPAADPDGRDRNVDWFYHGLDMQAATSDGRGALGDGRAAGDSAANGGAAGPPNPLRPPPNPAGQLPYWGKYVYHDNNRDINLSQVSMRAITDWYYTAHPPIMHDLHEAQPLMYTYSGGPPQNPNLDPLLFAELPWFSNWELAQMTKWGMPGVYTHAFMDGYSPGYLGSVAYNHNGMMRMYETQSGREPSVGRGAVGAGRDSSADSTARRGANAAGANAAGANAAGANAAGANAAGANAAGGGRGGRGGGGRGGRGGRGGAAGDSAQSPNAQRPTPNAGAPNTQRGGTGAFSACNGARSSVPTGCGGAQPREWYRGLPIPPNAIQNFTRRDNTNYMETGVLSALQLTSMFPQLILENFYIKTRNSLEHGSTEAPFGYVIPVQRDMTKVATLVNVLRAQGIEIGTLDKDASVGSDKFPAGSYVIKLNQPYGRLAKNLLERQDYPDPAIQTYDDSGWSMGYAFNVDVKEVKDKAILDAPSTLVKTAVVHGTVRGSGTAGLAVAHYGSNNMIAFRYKLRNVPMKIAEQSFTAEGVNFPAGSFIVTGSPADLQAARAQVEQLGLTAAALSSLPTVASHDGDAPRIAIYSQWNGTQELGWYRHAFDQFGIPYDLIFKERVEQGDLRKDYDVIIMAAQNINRTAVMAAKAAKPQPYEKSDKYKFLGMYGSTPDMSGGFGQAGADTFGKFLEQGGTLITALQSSRFPIEFGFAHTVDSENPTGVAAQKPLIQAEIVKANSPVFYGYENKIFPIKFPQGSQVFRVGIADQANVIGEYVGGDASVLSGSITGADNLRNRAFAVDIPQAYNGGGRVIMFANNPVYRWQNHGEFNMIFNSIMNWNDEPRAVAPAAATSSGR
ncbi:MAG TPA: M14 family zinc carboxypeptidase [Gemmatimonadaceae bacterium]|nr:M14 family zinc carboxypeptidase [Gemmatimonadaceae bacterium]